MMRTKRLRWRSKRLLPEIAAVIDKVVERLQNGGRLFYVGTGTSGRLGVLDASEIPPTFGVSYDLVQGIIAGGYDALYKATESSEDNREAGSEDLKTRGVTAKDAVIGIAASGRTPYTIGAVDNARELGCFTACITCVPDSAITHAVDIAISPRRGPRGPNRFDPHESRNGTKARPKHDLNRHHDPPRLRQGQSDDECEIVEYQTKGAVIADFDG